MTEKRKGLLLYDTERLQEHLKKGLTFKIVLDLVCKVLLSEDKLKNTFVLK